MGLHYPKPAKKAGSVSNQPIIKKVLKQGGLHVCGVCRKGFPYLALAFECLTNCVAQLNKNVSVTSVKSPTGLISYQCPLCRRSYKATPDAAQCLKACKKEAEQTFAQRQNNHEAQKLNLPPTSHQIPGLNASQNIDNFSKNSGTQPDTAKNIVSTMSLKEERQKKLEMFTRDGARYVCRRCKSRYFTQEDVEACYTKPCVEAPKLVTEKGSSPAQEEEQKPKSAVQAATREEREKYTRDGARYICAECNKRYFTREEVVECFDSH